MRKVIIIAILILCGWTRSYATEMVKPDSTGNGIHFQTGLKWADLLAKAKREHKFIFVDCYATWCGPCKQMERDVYPLQEVGAVYNKFVCVKYQLDSSKLDNEEVKAAYADAKAIRINYQITAFPTYLYLTEDGYLLGSQTGAMPPEDFIKVAQKTASFDNNYLGLLKTYNEGRATVKQIGELAQLSLNAKDTVRARKLLTLYLRELRPNQKFTKENISLLAAFTKTSKDPGFQFFLGNALSIDNVLKEKSYAEDILHNIIFQERIVPWLKKAKADKKVPVWANFKNQIPKGIREHYIEEWETMAKVSWYGNQKNWNLYVKYLIIFHEKYQDFSTPGHWTAFNLNNEAMEIFTYSNDLVELRKALEWSKQAVLLDPVPNWMDTYANILYKLGEKELAIKWEKFVVKNEPASEFILNLQKMQSGQPTWTSTN